MNRRLCLFGGLAVAALLSGGCSGQVLVPVSGVVRMDGAPLANAGVMFTPAGGGRPAEGTTDKEGRYILTYLDSDRGIPPGDYQVTVIKMHYAGANVGADGLAGDTTPTNIKEVWSTPKKYSTVEESGLSATIAPGQGSVDFELKSKP